MHEAIRIQPVMDLPAVPPGGQQAHLAQASEVAGDLGQGHPGAYGEVGCGDGFVHQVPAE